ncbi:sulfate transporter CysZ [Vibrio sp. SCSIO 43136]|uniref:sulfate transporter CysZ n=1 Tax=Vibrio sp. SCSIO 43136 TaxID=2819101 RepID=UPI0020752E19|nr:sulfate transporter CysZ [Vibrio sp. SCSIO 43136]USD64590.1 sulfate transporter CysZ [Vibrio sp. SCSIO 43136]
MHQNSLERKKRSGFGYFFYGIELAFTPGLRRFVAFPLITNIVLIGGALYYLFSQLGGWIDAWMGQLPDMLSWLSYVLWPILVLTILATFTYFFSTLANFIAAPFNGILAEQVEAKLTGKKLSDQSAISLVKDTPRILAREWRKLMYYLPKALGLFILLLIPALGQTLGPVLWFAFTAWMMAIQYCDYPFDNHKVSFQDMKTDLKSQQSKSYGFGILVAVFTTIPFLNLVVMPIAVCGATAMWVEEYRNKHV